MLAINVFVLPIAFGGLLRAFPTAASTPTRSCSRCRWRKSMTPRAARLHRRPVRRGRMIIVETIALSTMVCNDS
jgi:hypothetical protein